MIYDKLKEYRKEIVSWIAFFALMLSGIEFYLMPKIQKVARAETHRALYVIYSEFAEAYGSIPNRASHQEARLDYMKDKRDTYKQLMVSD